MKKVFAVLAVVAAFSTAQAESPIVNEPTEYGIPGWLQDLSDAFGGNGPAEQQCTGEHVPCVPSEYGVPSWMESSGEAPAFPGYEAP